jgi:ZIP family zinc transporter
MLEATIIGFISGSAILIGALFGLYLKIGHKTIATIMAFGAGVLISALSIDLMNDGFEQSKEPITMGLSFLAGALVFVLGDYFIDTNGGKFRKSTHGMEQNLKKDHPEDTSGTAILLGTLLDGIPESFVVGASVAAGGATGIVFIAAVFLSNLPEGMSGTISMKMSGMKTKNIIFLWLATLLVTVLSAIGGYLFLGNASPVVNASIMAFASGAILAMLCDTMIPEAFKFGGRFVALITVLGFLTAFMLSKVF